MAKNDKLEPTEHPEPLDSLREAFSKGMKDPDLRDALRVELRISGGMPGQDYLFEFASSGSGAAQSQIRDSLSDRHGKPKQASLEGKNLTRLLDAILTSGVLDLPEEPPQFLPDTVVGYLEVSHSDSGRRWYFAADEDQAQAQGKIPSREIKEVLETIYSLGEELLGMDSVRP